MGTRKLSERVRSEGAFRIETQIVPTVPAETVVAWADEIAVLEHKLVVWEKSHTALEDRLRVSEAKREVERDAADDWQEKAERSRLQAMRDYHASLLEGGDDE